MEKNNLKCVVGQVCENQPAFIRFFDSVDRWSVDDFKSEFLWLQDYVHPSKIVVLINSDGGSVVHGMAVYSLIAGCPIETDCVIEGIAASMGSVIWAAGDNLYMHDYSILMIHNPFMSSGCDDPNSAAIIDAFKAQLRTIYTKRFGLSESEVTDIMDGKEGVDGTYLSAQEAVSRGIISQEHVIETKQTAKDQLLAEIEAAGQTHSAADFLKVIARAETLDPESLRKALGAPAASDVKSQKSNNTMNADFIRVAALLGFTQDSVTEKDVNAKITELMSAVKELEALKAERETMNGQIMAKDTTIANLTAANDELQAKVKEFENAEAARKDAEILATIDAAIKAGKVQEDSKDKWLAFFKADEALAKQSLDTIPARVVVTDQIAGDKDAQEEALAKQKAIDDAKKAADEAAAKAGVVGFEFQKFEN